VNSPLLGESRGDVACPCAGAGSIACWAGSAWVLSQGGKSGLRACVLLRFADTFQQLSAIWTDMFVTCPMLDMMLALSEYRFPPADVQREQPLLRQLQLALPSAHLHLRVRARPELHHGLQAARGQRGAGAHVHLQPGAPGHRVRRGGRSVHAPASCPPPSTLERPPLHPLCLCCGAPCLPLPWLVRGASRCLMAHVGPRQA